MRRIRKEAPAAKLIPDILDLADLGSVRTFAERFLKRFTGASLDLLINNAGVYALGTRQVTSDGFERQFATNYIGPFAPTALLFPSIKRTLASRVVTVASIYSKSGKIDFDNLRSERSYRPVYGAYAMSKLADLMFGLELQNRLAMIDSPIASICAHPGYSITNIKHSTPLYIRFLDALPRPFLAQSAAQGALPTLFAATAPTAQAGGFYGPDGFLENKRISRSIQDSCSGARPCGRTTALEGIGTSHWRQLPRVPRRRRRRRRKHASASKIASAK